MIYFLLYHSYSVGSIEYKDSEHKIVSGCSEDLTEVVIPRSVVEIYSESQTNYAFMNCKTKIKSLQFEVNSQITKIGDYSFYQTSLETVDFSQCNLLLSLEQYVFSKCENLSSVTLPPNIITIGRECFSNDKKLTSIILPDSVVILENYAFDMSGLTTITINPTSKLEKIDYMCFYWTNLISLYIPQKVNKLDSSALAFTKIERFEVHPLNNMFKTDSKSLYSGPNNSTFFWFAVITQAEFVVPSFVTSLADSCFCGTKISSIKLPDSITDLGDSAFSQCIITSITIPPKVSIIGSSCFSGCNYLDEVRFLGNISKIEALAFISCNKLKSIELQESLVSIGFGAFDYC